jgi:hypothetical protein
MMSVTRSLYAARQRGLAFACPAGRRSNSTIRDVIFSSTRPAPTVDVDLTDLTDGDPPVPDDKDASAFWSFAVRFVVPLYCGTTLTKSGRRGRRRQELELGGFALLVVMHETRACDVEGGGLRLLTFSPTQRLANLFHVLWVPKYDRNRSFRAKIWIGGLVAYYGCGWL